MNTQKSTKKVSGIYKIINKTNDNYYVGSSDNILGTSGRLREHINDLRANRHCNMYLQNAWNKYGESNFEFIVVEEVSKEKLIETEQKYLDLAKPQFHNQTYNLSFCASGGGGMIGHKHSKETKRKMSEKLKGRIVSDITRKRLSDSLVGRKGGFVGKKQSEEWKKNQRETMRIYWRKRKGLPIDGTLTKGLH